MTLTELFLSQLADPFRIGLLIALLITTARNIRATGLWLPLAAGVVFVAVIIPVTLAPADGEVSRHIAVGLASNAVLLAVLLAAQALWRRYRG